MADSISAADLHRELGSGGVPEILDVRGPEDFAEARIEAPPGVAVRNVALWDVLDDPERYARDAADGVVVVCAHGNGSDMVADMFSEAGRRARNLGGGMLAWSALLVARPLQLPGPELSAWQVQRPAKGCLSYVVGAPGGGCVVVDPARFLDSYLELAEAHGMQIAHVVDTHLHADHVSGGPALASRTGAEYHLPAEDAGVVSFRNRPLVDGERLALGETELEVVALRLPGHTPGTTALLLRDRFLLGGDTVFVRGVGRPDLTGQARELAVMLYESVQSRLRALAPQTLILPAHWSSQEEIRADGLVATTLEAVLSTSLLQQTGDVDAFIEEILATLPSAPAVYERIREINTGLAVEDYELERVEVGRNQCAASGPAG